MCSFCFTVCVATLHVSPEKAHCWLQQGLITLASAVEFLIIITKQCCFPLQVIHGLQRKVDEQEEEIMQLRRQISRLQSSEVTVPSSESDKT